ncbi:hypothetical protein GQ457_02G023810 [Hibiscus cannabinus]
MENTTSTHHHHLSPLEPEVRECEGSSLEGHRRRRSPEVEPDGNDVKEEAMPMRGESREEDNGRVWIPEIWGQEELLKDWIDCSAFDQSLVPPGIMSARAALVEEGRRANSIENRC